jgi:nitrite reductase/ring-hydroxylating ferredoxin subunit
MPDRLQDSRKAPLRDCAGCGVVDRRAFLAQAALAGVAAFLAGCATGADTAGPSFTGPLTVSVADFPALATVGGIARVDGGGSPVAAVRLGATQYVAFSLVCPHQGATVGISGSGFRCPQHGALFTADGKWAGGQPTSNLHALSALFDPTTGVLTIS